MIAAPTERKNWTISLSPDPLEQAVVLVVVWTFSGGLLYGLSLLEGGLRPFWYALVLPFPSSSASIRCAA